MRKWCLFMDNQASIMKEKKLASFETVYKENVISKPQNINVTITEGHVYGVGFNSDQIGTQEQEPLYSKFSLSLAEITKVYVNINSKFTPLYIQCEDNSKGVMNRHRVILPGFKNNDEIIKAIEEAKANVKIDADAHDGHVDNQATVYTEKKLAFFESVYRENVLSKPQEVNITVTPQHIYGTAYVCDQKGVQESDPVYSRFTCGLDQITKIYINNNSKMAPIYIQCDEEINGVMNRHRIILPKFDDNDAIIKAVTDAKNELDSKLEIQREQDRNRRLDELEARRRVQDDEFERMTGGYKEMLKQEQKKASKPEPKPVTKPALAPAPKPAPAPAPKPAPAPAPVPKPAPAPAPAPKPATAPKPAPAPATAPKPAPVHDEFMSELAVPENSGSVTVEDILGIDDILGIRAEDNIPAAESFMDEISEGPAEEEINSMPMETIQKNPDKIEELVIPHNANEFELEEVHEEKYEAEIEELNTAEEIVKKLSPKPAPAPVPIPEPAPASAPKPASEPVPIIPEVKENSDVKAEDVSLEDFETAVKKLKSMLDNGLISESEFAVEKKKLFKLLY